jgi:hypothetical protein
MIYVDDDGNNGDGNRDVNCNGGNNGNNGGDGDGGGNGNDAAAAADGNNVDEDDGSIKRTAIGQQQWDAVDEMAMGAQQHAERVQALRHPFKATIN